MSPLLCNAYLHRLDRAWQAGEHGVLVRYVDDAVVMCDTRGQAEAALARLTDLLAGLGLEPKAAKTRIVHLAEGNPGFDFLGFHHRLVRGRTPKSAHLTFLARWPSRKAAQHARDRIREITGRERLLVPAEVIVTELNMFLRGWAGYFRYGNSARVLGQVGNYALWRLGLWLSKKGNRRHGWRWGVTQVLLSPEALLLVAWVVGDRQAAGCGARQRGSGCLVASAACRRRRQLWRPGLACAGCCFPGPGIVRWGRLVSRPCGPFGVACGQPGHQPPPALCSGLPGKQKKGHGRGDVAAGQGARRPRSVVSEVSNHGHQRKGNGVRSSRLWAKLAGCENTVIEDIGWHEDEGGRAGLRLVVHVRPYQRLAGRCGACGRKCPGYDRGQGRRRWRALDLGTVRAYLEADAPRVTCPRHGVITAAVPWARHGAAHTRFFEDQVAWLAAACSKTTITALMRISWRTVGVIIARVTAEKQAACDRLAGLRRIGIDEISYRRGHKYLVIVVDHDTGDLIWAAPGRSRATVRAFFDALGEDRSKLLTHVSADGAEWIAQPVRARAPQAVLCADPFHVVGWATEALDEVRRGIWRTARQAPGAVRDLKTGGRTLRLSTGGARDLRRARYPLWKNPENLTGRQQAKLAWIEKTHPLLYRAYLLKEGLRTALKLKGDEADYALSRWLAWAARCRIPEFITLGRRIRNHLPAIRATITHGLSNGLIESVNTKIRVLTRMAFGFHHPHALIALAMLAVGGLRPALPAR